jgi:hypothetical protein
MLKDATRRRFDVLMFRSIDRLGRSTAAVANALAANVSLRGSRGPRHRGVSLAGKGRCPRGEGAGDGRRDTGSVTDATSPQASEAWSTELAFDAQYDLADDTARHTTRLGGSQTAGTAVIRLDICRHRRRCCRLRPAEVGQLHLPPHDRAFDLGQPPRPRAFFGNPSTRCAKWRSESRMTSDRSNSSRSWSISSIRAAVCSSSNRASV